MAASIPSHDDPASTGPQDQDAVASFLLEIASVVSAWAEASPPTFDTFLSSTPLPSDFPGSTASPTPSSTSIVPGMRSVRSDIAPLSTSIGAPSSYTISSSPSAPSVSERTTSGPTPNQAVGGDISSVTTLPPGILPSSTSVVPVASLSQPNSTNHRALIAGCSAGLGCLLLLIALTFCTRAISKRKETCEQRSLQSFAPVMEDSWVKRYLRGVGAGSQSSTYPKHQLSYDSNGIGSARSTDGLFPLPDVELATIAPSTPLSCHRPGRHFRVQSYPPANSSYPFAFHSRHKSRPSLSTAVSISLQQEMNPTATTHLHRSRISDGGLPSETQSARSSMSTIIPIDSPLDEFTPDAFFGRTILHGRVQQSPAPDIVIRPVKHDSVTLPSCPDPCLTSRAETRRLPPLPPNIPSPVDNIDRFFDIPPNHLALPPRTYGASTLADGTDPESLRALSPGPSSR